MALIIDADAHFAEPMDLWLRYLEPKYRERAFHVERDKVIRAVRERWH